MNEQIQDLRKTIHDANMKIKQIQSECSHSRIRKMGYYHGVGFCESQKCEECDKEFGCSIKSPLFPGENPEPYSYVELATKTTVHPLHASGQ